MIQDLIKDVLIWNLKLWIWVCAGLKNNFKEDEKRFRKTCFLKKDLFWVVVGHAYP